MHRLVVEISRNVVDAITRVACLVCCLVAEVLRYDILALLPLQDDRDSFGAEIGANVSENRMAGSDDRLG